MAVVVLKGPISRNELSRWEVEGIELTSGSYLEVELGGRFVFGTLEVVDREYVFFTHPESLAIRLRPGLIGQIKVRS